MKLWRELLIGGLQNENCEFDYVCDKQLKKIIESQCYNVLQQIKKVLDDENLSDKDCFDKIEEIIRVLEENGVFCDRHDF